MDGATIDGQRRHRRRRLEKRDNGFSLGHGEFLKPMEMSHYTGLETKREVCARRRKWGKSAAFRAHFN